MVWMLIGEAGYRISNSARSLVYFNVHCGKIRIAHEIACC